MKKYFLLLFIFIPLYLFSNVMFWTTFEEYRLKRMLFTKSEDLKLKGKIKEYTEEYDSFNYYFNWKTKNDLKSFPVNLKAKWKDLYYFDNNGNIIKKESFSDNVLLIQYNYIYTNNKLQEIIISSSDRFTPLIDNYKYNYNKRRKNN